MSRGDVFRPLVIWLGGNALSFSSFPEKTQSVAPQVFLIPVCVFNPANRSARRPARAPAGKRNFTNRVLAKLRHCDLAFAYFSNQGDYANHLRLLEKRLLHCLGWWVALVILTAGRGRGSRVLYIKRRLYLDDTPRHHGAHLHRAGCRTCGAHHRESSIKRPSPSPGSTAAFSFAGLDARCKI